MGVAVGDILISLLIPWQRVVGTDGSLTGYAGGIDRKQKLLEMEKADMRDLYVPGKQCTLRDF